MTFVNKWITAALAALCIVVLLLYCRWLSHQLNQLRNEKQQAVVAQAEERVYSARIRTQYLQIQEVMDGVAEQREAHCCIAAGIGTKSGGESMH